MGCRHKEKIRLLIDDEGDFFKANSSGQLQSLEDNGTE